MKYSTGARRATRARPSHRRSTPWSPVLHTSTFTHRLRISSAETLFAKWTSELSPRSQAPLFAPTRQPRHLRKAAPAHGVPQCGSAWFSAACHGTLYPRDRARHSPPPRRALTSLAPAEELPIRRARRLVDALRPASSSHGCGERAVTLPPGHRPAARAGNGVRGNSSPAVRSRTRHRWAKLTGRCESA